jgi:hypothetical protein
MLTFDGTLVFHNIFKVVNFTSAISANTNLLCSHSYTELTENFPSIAGIQRRLSLFAAFGQICRSIASSSRALFFHLRN